MCGTDDGACQVRVNAIVPDIVVGGVITSQVDIAYSLATLFTSAVILHSNS
jgi:hypothetical protein